MFVLLKYKYVAEILVLCTKQMCKSSAKKLSPPLSAHRRQCQSSRSAHPGQGEPSKHSVLCTQGVMWVICVAVPGKIPAIPQQHNTPGVMRCLPHHGLLFRPISTSIIYCRWMHIASRPCMAVLRRPLCVHDVVQHCAKTPPQLHPHFTPDVAVAPAAQHWHPTTCLHGRLHTSEERCSGGLPMPRFRPTGAA